MMTTVTAHPENRKRTIAQVFTILMNKYFQPTYLNTADQQRNNNDVNKSVLSTQN